MKNVLIIVLMIVVLAAAVQADLTVPTDIKLGNRDSNPNSTVSAQFTITNTENSSVTGISSKITADPRYRLSISGLPTELSAGQSATVTLSGFTASEGGSRSVGSLAILSNQINKSSAITMESSSALSIKRIRFDFDGKGDTVSDGEKVDFDVSPGSKGTLRIEFENLYDDNREDIDIDNVDVDVTIEDIDDGDDIDESFDFDIRAGDTEEITLNFEVPIDADEDTYTVDIRADGEEDNGRSVSASARVEFEVQRERDDVRITRFATTPSTVSCDRQIVLGVEITNYGSDEQDHVSIGIKQPQLGIDVNQFNIVLDNELDQSDSKYRRDIRHTIPATVAPGTYSIELTAFNENDFSAFQTAEVVVQACAGTTPTPSPPTPAPTPVPTPAPPVTGGVTVDTPKPSEDMSFNTVLILGGINLILLVAIIAVVAKLMQKD